MAAKFLFENAKNMKTKDYIMMLHKTLKCVFYFSSC